MPPKTKVEKVLTLLPTADESNSLIQVLHSTVFLAGEEGFEPSDGGSKVRCLTTWLLPSDTPGLSRIGEKRGGGAPSLREHLLRINAGYAIGKRAKAAQKER